MKKLHTYRPMELSMRIILAVQERQSRDPHFLMGELAEGVVLRYGCSRACAYRYLRLAVDVLGIPYEGDPLRSKRRNERSLDGKQNARARGKRRKSSRPGLSANHPVVMEGVA